MSKRLLMIAAAVVAVVALGACSPETEIHRVFGGSADAAIRVARCESNLEPGAVSAGGGNHGLFQINNVHRDEFRRVTGQPWDAVYDAYWNTVYAKYLYDHQGWRPWTCKP